MKKFNTASFIRRAGIWLFGFLCCFKLSATNVSGPQSGTWTVGGSPYVLTATVTVLPGTTLTIDPGVTVSITTGSIQLQVQGTLTAIGTSVDSIHFIRNGSFHGSDQAVPISFEASSTGSVLEYVKVDNLGFYSYNDMTFAILINSSSCQVSNCTIQNIQGTAIGIGESAKPTINNNAFQNSPYLDIVLHPDELKNIVANDSLRIGLINNTVPIASTDTLKAENIFYRLLTSITIPLGKRFTINPGTEVQFNTGAVQLNVQGTLKAAGISGQNIKFFRNGALHGSDQVVPISFGTVSQNSILEYVTIDGLGYYSNNDGTAVIVIRSSSCTIDNCFIQNIQGSAILIGKGARPDINHNTISSSNLDVVLDPDKIRNLSNNNSLKIGLTDSIPMALDDTLTSNNALYRLLNTVTIPQNRVLAINPNVIVQFPTGAIQLIVQGTLKALGSVDNNIQFNRIGAFHGSDQAVPIVFDVNSQNSLLQYLTINELGYYNFSSTTPVVVVKSSSLNVVNTIIESSQGLAVEIQNSASPTFTQDCFYSNISGAVLSTGGKSKFQNCNFLGNTSGIVNTSATDTVIAINCWWGDASGPFQRTTNPAGVGDSVSDRVLYRPFSTDQFDCSTSAPVPLTLLSFQAFVSGGNYVNCIWQTATEFNTSNFIVERSIDGTNFNEIGKVSAAGNSSITKNYGFADNFAIMGINYYRLKMVDKDGKYVYSKIVSINIKIKTSFVIYPNPAKENLFMQVQRDHAEKVILQITDIHGKILHEERQQLQAGITSMSYNTSALSKGTYLVLIKGQKSEAKTFVKE